LGFINIKTSLSETIVVTISKLAPRVRYLSIQSNIACLIEKVIERRWVMIGRLVTKERGQRKSKRPKGKGKGHDIPKSKGMPTCWKSMKPWHIKKCCNSQE